MKTYEGMFLVDTRHANRDWDRVVAQVNEIVSKHGGRMIRCEKWGERKLAYPIAGNKRGVYLLTYFEADGEAANGVYREVELSETFLRALILAVDKAPDEILRGEDSPPDDEDEKEGADKPASGAKEAPPEAPAKAASEAPAEVDAPAAEEAKDAEPPSDE